MALSLALATGTSAAGVDLTDVDVEGITSAAAEFHKGPLAQISAGNEKCTFTAETECSVEVYLTISTGNGLAYLTVSKLDGIWKVGQWQRELIAYRKCLNVMDDRHSAQAAAGNPVSREQFLEDQTKCFGPSGRVGGMRGSKW